MRGFKSLVETSKIEIRPLTILAGANGSWGIRVENSRHTYPAKSDTPKSPLKRGIRLQAIMWVNPDKSEEQAVAWLKDGAPHEPKRCLGYVIKEIS